MPTLYGIPNCGSVKKAKVWFQTAGVDVAFVDFKKTAPSREQVKHWLAAVGADTLLNRRGLGWRAVDEATREAVLASEEALLDLLLEKPILIKRPVIEFESGTIVVGVDEDRWRNALG